MGFQQPNMCLQRKKLSGALGGKINIFQAKLSTFSLYKELWDTYRVKPASLQGEYKPARSQQGARLPATKSIVLVSHSTPVADLSKYEKNNTRAGMCLADLLPTSLTNLFLQLSSITWRPVAVRLFIFSTRAANLTKILQPNCNRHIFLTFLMR